MPCSRPNVGARGPPRRACVPRLAGFLKVVSRRTKKSESALSLVRIHASVSFKVRSGCSVTRANIFSACASNENTPPPRGFGLALRLLLQCCSHLTTELTLVSKCSAARRPSPAYRRCRSRGRFRFRLGGRGDASTSVTALTCISRWVSRADGWTSTSHIAALCWHTYAATNCE
jgi:hypothetical protein